MDILDKYYVFCTLDEELIEPSYIFFRTLFKYNSYIKLHVHCINFSKEKLEEYSKVINTYWKDNIEIISEEIHLNAPPPPHFKLWSCTHHYDALMSKIIICGRRYKPYMFHLDLDMIVRGDFSELFQKYSEELIGHCYDSEVVNAGVMIVHVPDRDISVDLNEYLHSSYINSESYVPDEGYIVHQHLRTKVIHAKYCASYYARSGITISVSKIVHLLSDFKPYRSWDKVNTDKLIIIPMFKEWLDVYDSFDKSLFPTISPIVEKNRSTIEKLAPLCKRMYNIK